MNQPEDGVEHLGIVGLLLETHELDVDLIEALACFGQEFSQELVHSPPQGARRGGRTPKAPVLLPEDCLELWFTFR